MPDEKSRNSKIVELFTKSLEETFDKIRQTLPSENTDQQIPVVSKPPESPPLLERAEKRTPKPRKMDDEIVTFPISPKKSPVKKSVACAKSPKPSPNPKRQATPKKTPIKVIPKKTPTAAKKSPAAAVEPGTSEITPKNAKVRIQFDDEPEPLPNVDDPDQLTVFRIGPKLVPKKVKKPKVGKKQEKSAPTSNLNSAGRQLLSQSLALISNKCGGVKTNVAHPKQRMNVGKSAVPWQQIGSSRILVS
jgi:hypothetical protein